MAINFNRNPIYWFTAGSIIGQLVSFIMLPIYTSYLTPADYGILTLLIVVMSVYELFLGAQFGRSLPKFYFEQDSQDKKDAVVYTCLGITVCVSTLGAIAFYLSAPFISTHAFEDPSLTGIVSIYALMMLTTTIESYVMVLCRLKDNPAFFFCMSVGKLLVQLSLNIYTVTILEMGLVGVLYSSILSSALFAGISLLYTVRSCRFNFDSDLIRPLFIFTWPLWLAGAGNIYVSMASNFLIKEFGGLAEVGLFFLALKFAMIMSLMIWRPFSQWWQTERFKIINDSEQHYKLPLIFSLITYILLTSAVGLSLLSGIVMKVMVNSAFYASFPLVFLVAFRNLFFHQSQIFNLPLLHVGKTKTVAWLSWARALLMTILIIPLTYFFGMTGAAYAFLVTALVILLLTARIAKPCFDMQIKFTKTAVLVTASFIYVYLALKFIDISDSLAQVSIACGLSLSLFLGAIGVIFYLDKPTRQFLVELVFKKKADA
ncbi:oligosaccharide flippase family protein [Alteromonas sp. ASW11-36]|uniref:Oligosaccharide flippase family protein n=1 Tax=Alteromonas arenosi TaxID=3055817 RepID=A0ABT7SVR3_9ALTE|nr:oligosaccharide flippase family protein [Alteromonas sp. ASW11-36]MDM7859637.1 oligosaccharide flippase family protein [Alteromonas sp. ASW11-36]